MDNKETELRNTALYQALEFHKAKKKPFTAAELVKTAETLLRFMKSDGTQT